MYSMITCSCSCTNSLKNLHNCESSSFLLSVYVLFFLKRGEKSVIAEILFNSPPIKINLCKQFTRTKCSLETSGKSGAFCHVSCCLCWQSPVMRETVLDRNRSCLTRRSDAEWVTVSQSLRGGLWSCVWKPEEPGSHSSCEAESWSMSGSVCVRRGGQADLERAGMGIVI